MDVITINYLNTSYIATGHEETTIDKSSGVPCISGSGMYLQSRVWTYGLFMVACLCCSSLLIGASNPVTNPEEVKALLAIKSSLIDPCGNLSDWDQGDPYTSNWPGVFCYNTTLDDGYLHVQRLLRDGNRLTGPLPEELGYLPNMDRIQIDENQISGPLPKSFANLNKTKHFHMNNNSISGQIPPELSRLPSLAHFLLDNNNLSGYLPEEFFKLPKLQNHFVMTKDLSSNQLNGTIPLDRFSENITTMELQYNKLSNINFTSNSSIPPNVTVGLKGNPLCWDSNLAQFCESETEYKNYSQNSTNTTSICPAQACPPPCEYSPTSPVACFCAFPQFVGYRLKSPGFSDFRPYRHEFEVFLTSHLELSLYQLYIDSFTWEEGPRLVMNLKFFPVYDAENKTHAFNRSELQRMFDIFTTWNIRNPPDKFVPYEFISFPLLDFEKDDGANFPSSGLSKGALAGLVLGTIAVAVTLSAVVTLLIMRRRVGKYHSLSRRRRCEYLMFVKLRFSAKCKEPLSFVMRLRIALGSAKGILYLHTEANPPIFHRDIKASNILLDSKYMAKVADFGLSRLAPVPDIEGTMPAHVSIVVRGTPGYLDLEYFLTGKLTDKSDVYSLGVVFLELLTGKQPISHGKNIIREVNVECKSGMIFSVIDGQMGSYPPECVNLRCYDLKIFNWEMVFTIILVVDVV
ncbi:putative lrr receptor-like serine/threonine-protein kinase [Quercus suber]|uniref:non-specific serine/threonine protein kinase n=1 Tax=Quercus suber TaxID=58331 RepID=A0AAW0L2E1_QUESU